MDGYVRRQFKKCLFINIKYNTDFIGLMIYYSTL